MGETQPDTACASADCAMRRGRLMKAATVASVTVALLLAGLKSYAVYNTHSVSVLTSLVDSFFDIVTSVLNFIAVRFALQPADKEHRFGHGKAEDIAALCQSMFIAGSGLFVIGQAVLRLYNPEPVTHSELGIWVMVISLAVTVGLVVFQHRVIRSTGSVAIEGDAFHYVTDLMTNGGVIVALVLTSRFGLQWADPVIAILIALGILWQVKELVGKSLNHLMDHEFEPEERESIKQRVRGHGTVLGIHDLRTRRSGSDVFIQFHLDLSKSLSFEQAHEVTEEVEAALMKDYPGAQVFIHQDPV